MAARGGSALPIAFGRSRQTPNGMVIFESARSSKRSYNEENAPQISTVLPRQLAHISGSVRR
jgi:hypothetical protein